MTEQQGTTTDPSSSGSPPKPQQDAQSHPEQPVLQQPEGGGALAAQGNPTTVSSPFVSPPPLATSLSLGMDAKHEVSIIHNSPLTNSDSSIPHIRTESVVVTTPAGAEGTPLVGSAAFAATKPAALCRVDFGVTSEQGTRKTMEDQHVAVVRSQTPHASDFSFFGVYDGHGGTQCADYLQQNLHDFILNHPQLRADTTTAIKDAIARAEKDFMEKCRVEKIESGSTVACAVIIGQQLTTANVGDSEIVLCRNGAPLLLTTKHHLGCNEAEVKRVQACGGRIFHSRIGHPKFNPHLVSLAVSRAIGDAGFKLDEYTDGKNSGVIADPEIKTVTLEDGDAFLIIGCDGLWDVINYADAVTFCLGHLEKGATSQAISHALVQEALSRGSTDNVTVMFVQLSAPQQVLPTPTGAC